MESQLPPDTSLFDRLRRFANFLDDRITRVEELLETNPVMSDRHYRLKTERAEITAIRMEFRQLFKSEIQN